MDVTAPWAEAHGYPHALAPRGPGRIAARFAATRPAPDTIPDIALARAGDGGYVVNQRNPRLHT